MLQPTKNICFCTSLATHRGACVQGLSLVRERLSEAGPMKVSRCIALFSRSYTKEVTQRMGILVALSNSLVGHWSCGLPHSEVGPGKRCGTLLIRSNYLKN
jgi:hypothetical protein